MFDKYPYANFHEMNLDWIIKEMEDLIDAWDSYGTAVTAEAHTASSPEVTVTGDLKKGLNFDFGLVQGPRGYTGPMGPQGAKGDHGEGLQILDVYPTLNDLQTAHPTGEPGDAYLVGSGSSYVLYIWSDTSSAWVEGGSLTTPSPANTDPLMDGTASIGSSIRYARADHVHPSDTSKVNTSDYETDQQYIDQRFSGVSSDIGTINNSITDLSSNVSTLDSNLTTLTSRVNSLQLDLKCLVINATSISSLPATINNELITSDHVVVNSYLSNPEAQTEDWTVTTSSGSLTISGSISGSTTVTLYLLMRNPLA